LELAAPPAADVAVGAVVTVEQEIRKSGKK
jgi:hypothetical protein